MLEEEVVPLWNISLFVSERLFFCRAGFLLFFPWPFVFLGFYFFFVSLVFFCCCFFFLLEGARRCVLVRFIVLETHAELVSLISFFNGPETKRQITLFFLLVFYFTFRFDDGFRPAPPPFSVDLRRRLGSRHRPRRRVSR